MALIPLALPLVSWSLFARAGSVERPDLPAWSMAGDDGAAALWRNPANLGFDPDSGYALLYQQPLDDQYSGTFSAAGNTGPVGFGLQYTTGPEGEPWWTLASGLGLRMSRDLSLGLNIGWQIPSGPENNLTTWDFGAGYRPLPWLGVAAVVQNIGDPAPAQGVEERYGAGVVFRPFGDTAALGVDYLMTAPTGSTPEGIATATLRLHPTNGLFLRASGDSEGTVGAGLEIAFGGASAGAHAALDPSDTKSGSVLGYLMSSDAEEQLFGGHKSVPHFNLADAVPYEPGGGLFSRPQESYLHLLGRLQHAASDPRTRGLLVHLDEMPLNLAQIQEVRAILQKAHDRGKPVVVYLDRATSNGAYLLASVADKIYLHPAAQVDLIGLSAEIQFYRGALDLVGVKPQFARRAEYKSAVESYTNTESSPANQEEMNALLDDLSEVLVSGIAEGRKKDPEAVRALIDGGPYTAKEALSKGLIDGVLYPDDLDDGLSGVFADGYDLNDSYGMEDESSGWRAPNAVGIVYIDGVITSGPSEGPGLFGGEGTAGSDTIVAQLEAAREDDSVKALVLRVDSPGGSAFASDEIWRAVEELEQSKPVIVSMGGVAASGGYYVSAGATRIFAEPGTITGSIGVFGGKISLEGLYDKVGINYEQFNRGRNAAMYSLSKPFDAQEFATLDRLIGDTYDQFKSRVGDGRNLEPAKVEEIARGRVWSGTDGLTAGLVDELGGLSDALRAARVFAGLPDGADVEIVSFQVGDGGEGHVTRTNALAGPPRLRMPDAIRSRLPALKPPPLPPEFATLEQWRRLAVDPIWMVLPYRLDVK